MSANGALCLEAARRSLATVIDAEAAETLSGMSDGYDRVHVAEGEVGKRLQLPPIASTVLRGQPRAVCFPPSFATLGHPPRCMTPRNALLWHEPPSCRPPDWPAPESRPVTARQRMINDVASYSSPRLRPPVFLRIPSIITVASTAAHGRPRLLQSRRERARPVTFFPRVHNKESPHGRA